MEAQYGGLVHFGVKPLVVQHSTRIGQSDWIPRITLWTVKTCQQIRNLVVSMLQNLALGKFGDHNLLQLGKRFSDSDILDRLLSW